MRSHTARIDLWLEDEDGVIKLKADLDGQPDRQVWTTDLDPDTNLHEITSYVLTQGYQIALADDAIMRYVGREYGNVLKLTAILPTSNNETEQH
jgi:hypothetical protein